MEQPAVIPCEAIITGPSEKLLLRGSDDCKVPSLVEYEARSEITWGHQHKMPRIKAGSVVDTMVFRCFARRDGGTGGTRSSKCAHKDGSLAQPGRVVHSTAQGFQHGCDEGDRLVHVGTKGDVDRSRRAVSSQWRGTRDGAGPDLGGEEREQRNEEVRDRIGPGHQGSGTASDQYFYCVE